MSELTSDIPRRRRFRAGMVGGGRGAFFAAYHRAAMRICNRYEIVAGAFSSDPLLCREAGEAFGLEPERIYLNYEENAKLTNVVPGWVLDDNDVVLLEFDGGADGLLWTSLAAPGHRNGLRFKIIGSKGALEWQQETPETLLFGRLGESDMVYRRGQRDLTSEAMASVSLPAGNPEAYLEALAILYADYAKALEAGRNWRSRLVVPLADAREGLRGVALSKACLESSQKRAWVPFPAD